MPGWKPLERMSILGKHYTRLDGPDKVSGRARYTHDMRPEGCLAGAILSSPHAAARIKKIDATRAEKLAGVKAVLTDVHPTGTVRLAGEFVAAVAADTLDIARDALERIEVEYDVLPHVVDLEAAMKEDAPRVFEGRSNVRGRPRPSQRGDVKAGFAEADAIVEAEYRTQVQTHSTLELHGSTALWEGDQLTVWDSTQGVHAVRSGLAGMLEIPENKVRVICRYMGGGFGSKLRPGTYSAIAARLARKATAPVKLMLSRPQDSTTAGNRPSSVQRLKIGARSDGTLTAFAATTYGTAGIAGGAGVSLPYVYEIPNWSHRHSDVLTNAGASRPFRAPGRPQASFGMEGILDELAEKLGIDPLELRLRNDPSPTRKKEWAIGAARAGWKNRSRKPGGGGGSGPIKRGLGLAASYWAVPGRGTRAEITLYPDGGVDVRCGTQDIGTGTRTIVAAVAAEELGIRIDQVRPMIGDTEYPVSGSSGGSMTVASVAPAIKDTAGKARLELAGLAGRQLGVPPDRIVLAGGRASVADNPSASLSWKELCALLGKEPRTFHGTWVPGLSGVGVAGCQFADVEVDTRTGRIAVQRVVAVADCGLILDRLTTESQVIGGIIQGTSYALFEERIMDAGLGLQVNPNYDDYKIAGALEAPEVEVILYDEPERGVLGIGEPPTIPTSAAIANAVYNAAGVRMRELPMTPDRVLAALEERG